MTIVIDLVSADGEILAFHTNVEKTSDGKIVLYDFLPEYQNHIEKLMQTILQLNLNYILFYFGQFKILLGIFKCHYRMTETM